MKIDQVFKVIELIPWKKMGENFPSADHKKRLEHLKKEINDAIVLVEENTADWTIQDKFDKITEEFRSLSRSISTQTSAGKELYSKARLNEVVAWSMAEYSERAIFLAGKASTSQRIKEPYKTQIINQASHGCLCRYRQAAKIREYMSIKLDGAVNKEIDEILNQMIRSLVNEFLFFAELAHQDNETHALSSYNRTLSNLIAAFEKNLSGQELAAKSHIECAEELVQSIRVPEAGIHYMQRLYHITNFKEFATFKRLGRRHKSIYTRLEYLSVKADEIPEDSILIPRDKLDIGSIIGTGARAASLAAIIVAGAGFADVSVGDVRDAMSDLWLKVADIVDLGGPETGISIIEAKADGPLRNTGGLATLVANTGGLADKVSLMA